MQWLQIAVKVVRFLFAVAEGWRFGKRLAVLGRA